MLCYMDTCDVLAQKQECLSCIADDRVFTMTSASKIEAQSCLSWYLKDIFAKL